MELKYTVASSAEAVVITKTDVDGHPAELHQTKHVVELLPENIGNGSIKLVVPAGSASEFVVGKTVVASFTVEE